jgi:phenylacetate-CoA ligase
MNSDQRLRSIIDNRCTAIVCTPTYALHLAEIARLNGINLRDSSVRTGIHAGEPGASLPNVRKQIEDAWGMRCYDHAGATEVGAWSFECEARCGAIHLNEAEFIFEVIDPVTGLQAAEDARGELVITNLGRASMPVLRYRTGDLVELIRDRCSCGRGFARIRGGVLGRADDMFTVRGVNLYPGPIDNLVRSVAGVVEYEVNIRRVQEMDDLLIRIEIDGRLDEVTQALKTAFRREFNIRVSIEPAPTGTLPRYEFKARRYRRV